MEFFALIFVFGVIAYILGQINELLEGNLLWEKLKLGALTVLLLPFAGFALGGFVSNKMGFKATSWEMAVLGIACQAAYLLLIMHIFQYMSST